MERKRCNYNEGDVKYDTVDKAKDACDVAIACHAVYDHACDRGLSGIYLCKGDKDYGNSIFSCIYTKGNFLSFIFL